MSKFLDILGVLGQGNLDLYSCDTDKLSLSTRIQQKSRGALIERAHYYTILVEGIRTIREGVLFEGGVLTEVVR